LTIRIIFTNNARKDNRVHCCGKWFVCGIRNEVSVFASGRHVLGELLHLHKFLETGRHQLSQILHFPLVVLPEVVLVDLAPSVLQIVLAGLHVERLLLVLGETTNQLVLNSHQTHTERNFILLLLHLWLNLLH